MSDYLTNFCFGKAVTWIVPKENEAVIPAALERIWTVDNHREKTIWEVGQTGCTVPEAEALTPEGWKNLWELQARPDLPIATLHPKTGAFEWQSARLNIFQHAGPMVHYAGQRVEQLLTPDHDVWVRQSKTYTIRGGKRWDHGSFWRKRKAVDTSGPSWSIRGGASQFVGHISALPVIPKSREKPEYAFPSHRTFARFIGWWISEGDASDAGRMSVAQTKEVHPEYWAEILSDLQALHLPCVLHEQPTRIRFSHVGIARWLASEFGRLQKERHIPGWVKEMPPEILLELMDCLWKGDGSKGQNTHAQHVSECTHTWVYSTNSQKLADDVQEVAMKLGWLTYVSVERRQATKPNQLDKWVVHIDPRGTTSFPKSAIEHYVGTVWCPTVPNGLWFMRYAGRSTVTGNSVTGDAFVKIAYEEEWTDPAGFFHPGRVRILPLNPAFCLDDQTEIFTSEGWKSCWDTRVGDIVRTLDPDTGHEQWEPILRMNRFYWDGPLAVWDGPEVYALSTPEHRWITPDGFVTTSEVTSQRKIRFGEDFTDDFSVSTRHYTGWVWCPTTKTGTWRARREVMPETCTSEKRTFWTGNSYPEWAPHDRTRMLRFKLKYKFRPSGEPRWRARARSSPTLNS